MQTKTCSKCGLEKELSKFYKCKRHSTGYRSECKACSKIINHECFEKYKAERLESNKAYYKSNKEHINKRNYKWASKNKNKIRQHKKKWKINNPEIVKEHDRKRRARKRNVNECYTAMDEAYTRELFDHKCANCESINNLCIDHHYPLVKGNSLTRSNAVLLCKKCNAKKGSKNPEDFYPKEKLKEIEIILFSS